MAVSQTSVETEEDSHGHKGLLFSILLYYVNGVGLSLALPAFGGLQGLTSGDPISSLEQIRLLWGKQDCLRLG